MNRILTDLEKEYIEKYCNHYNIDSQYYISPTFNINYS